MHKVMIAIVAAGLFSLGASSAFAQRAPQTADMTVTGTIVPAACSATFSNPVLDFGRIRLIDLPANQYHQLGSRDTVLTVTCNAVKTVSFSITDAQAATTIADAAMATLVGVPFGDIRYLFGLGAATVNGTSQKLGAYGIGHNHVAPTVDTVSRTVIYAPTPGAWGVSYAYWAAGGAFTAGSGATASTGRTFVFPMRVTAALNYGSHLQVAQDTPLNGQAIFTINYQ